MSTVPHWPTNRPPRFGRSQSRSPTRSTPTTARTSRSRPPRGSAKTSHCRQRPGERPSGPSSGSGFGFDLGPNGRGPVIHADPGAGAGTHAALQPPQRSRTCSGTPCSGGSSAWPWPTSNPGVCRRRSAAVTGVAAGHRGGNPLIHESTLTGRQNLRILSWIVVLRSEPGRMRTRAASTDGSRSASTVSADGEAGGSEQALALVPEAGGRLVVAGRAAHMTRLGTHPVHAPSGRRRPGTVARWRGCLARAPGAYLEGRGRSRRADVHRRPVQVPVHAEPAAHGARMDGVDRGTVGDAVELQPLWPAAG